MKKHVLIIGGFYKLHQKIKDLDCDITFVTTVAKMRDYSKKNLYTVFVK